MGRASNIIVAVRNKIRAPKKLSDLNPLDTIGKGAIDLASGINPLTKKVRSKRPDDDFVEEVNLISAQLTARQRRRRCILVPGYSKILPWVDLLMFAALIYTATFTPFEVSFLESLTGHMAWANPRFLMNRVVDIIFVIDCILQFFIAYEKHKQNHDDDEDIVDVSHDEQFVFNRRKIACRYLRSWLLFDLMTIGVSIFDILPTLTPSGTLGAIGGVDPQDLVILRVVRILRLVKLLRLARAERIYARWEARITLTYGQQTIIRCIVMLFLSAHWYACIFALQATMHDSPRQTWMGQDLYAICPLTLPDAQPASELDANSTAAAYGTEMEFFQLCGHIDFGSWYLASFTWAAMIITGTGGTDFYPSVRSDAETVVVLMLNIIGALIWTQVLALFCDVATNAHPGMALFRQTLDDLNNFIDTNNVKPKLALRLREYLHEQKGMQLRHSVSNVVSALSPSLQVETILTVHRAWLTKIRFMSKLEKQCIVQLAMSMHEIVLAPGELAPKRHLYVVKWGVVLYGGKVLTSGKLWGDDMILSDERYVLPHVARMMTYVGGMSMSREQLLSVVANYPKSMAQIRRSAVLLALGRHLINAMREHKLEKARKNGVVDFDDAFAGGVGGIKKDLLSQVSAAAHEDSSKAMSEGRGSPSPPPMLARSTSTCSEVLSGAPSSLSPSSRAPSRDNVFGAAGEERRRPSLRASLTLSSFAVTTDAKAPFKAAPSPGNYPVPDPPPPDSASASSMARVESRIDSLDARMSSLTDICARLASTVDSIDGRLAALGAIRTVPGQHVNSARGRPEPTVGAAVYTAPISVRERQLAARTGWSEVDRRPPSITSASRGGGSPSVRC